ncbi:MAG: replication initiation protein [Bacteroidales bacterium]|jgi:plasmid replication initiation protein|nr:replication initiation protein [Bacteroidales bacterium]
MKQDNYETEQGEKDQHAIERVNVLQSYILTTARYDFNVYEKRILYRIVEGMQFLLKGEKLNMDLRFRINKLLFDLYEVEMPLNAFLSDEEDKNHVRAKDALRRMQQKTFEYEDDREWKSIPLIGYPKIHKYESMVKFKLHEDIYDALMNFSKGFKKYELKTAFKFKSVYAMRFYELFSGQKTPLIYSIKDLKLMFGVEKKYKLTADFIKRVVITAQRELNEKSPYSFEYRPLKKGREIVNIKFYPVTIPENVDEEFEAKELRRKLSPAWMIERQNLLYLKEHYMFSTPEIKNNIELFEMAQKEIPDLLYFLSEVKAKANRATNPKGYLINALRKRLNIRAKKK